MGEIFNTLTGRRVEVERKRSPLSRVVHSIKRTAPDGLGDKPYRRSETIEMELGEWMDIPRNPRQRDEIVRIEKGNVAHLLTPDPMHAVVALAMLPDGSRYKLDGHTRTAAWRMGMVEAPSKLLVDVYECADYGAVLQLYDRFDNSLVAETGTDRVTGAYNQAGIAPKSSMLKSGEISTAIRELFHYIHRTSPKKETKNDVINEGILLFAPEIKLLDEINPPRSRFPGGIVMGALITLAGESDVSVEFWTEYAADNGKKSDGRMDAVQALSEKVAQEKRRGSRARNTGLMATAVAAVGGYRKDKTYTIQHGITAKAKDPMREYANQVMASKGVS